MRHGCPWISVLLCLIGGLARAENWPAWRGPLGTGICAQADLPMHWSGRENVRWRTPLPDRGNSTPVVWGDRVFVTQAIEKEHRRTLMCFARSDGRRLWQSGVVYAGHEPTNAQNPYCSSSPVTDGRRVIAYFGSAGLHCYDFEGKELWSRDVGKVDSWQGSGSSPIIYGDLCILNAGPGTNAAVIACNTGTGDLVWKAAPPKVTGRAAPGAPPPAPGGFDNAIAQADPSGAGGFLGSWTTPVVIRSGDSDQVVVVHSFQVTAYEPRTGREIWTCKGLTEQAFASPVAGDGVLVACGHRLSSGGTKVTAVRLGGRGDVTGTHRLWQIDLPKECVGSGVIAHGRVYLPTQFGSIVCLDLPSGRKLWEKRLAGEGTLGGSWSSIVLAGDKLLIPNQSAEVFVLSAASPRFELLCVNRVTDEPCCASLAVSEGQVYLRTYRALWCLGEPRPQSQKTQIAK